MSGKLMGMCWDLDLPANKLMVLMALADHAQHNGTVVYPSLGLVAWKTGYSLSQTRRIIRALAKDGILTIEPRRGDTNIYHIDLSKAPQKPPYTDEKTPAKTPDDRGVILQGEGCHFAGGGVSSRCEGGGVIQMTPEPSLNRNYIKDSAPDGAGGSADIGEEPAVSGPVPKTPRKRSEKQLENDRMVLALAQAYYGTETYALGDYSLILKTAKTLCRSGIVDADWTGYIAYVRQRSAGEGHWTVTLTSLTSGGRMTDFLTRRNGKNGTRESPGLDVMDFPANRTPGGPEPWS